MKKATIYLTSKQTKEEIVIYDVFGNEEWEVFQEYCEYAKELTTTKFAQTKRPLSFTMKADKESGFIIEGEFPPWDDVIGLLHRLRPFILEKERTNFNKVCAILGKRINNDAFRKFLKQRREVYTGERLQKKIRIIQNDMILNSEEFLNDWLNAYEFHRDKNKREKIKRLHEFFPIEGSKPILLLLLYDKYSTIVEIASLLEFILKMRQ